MQEKAPSKFGTPSIERIAFQKHPSQNRLPLEPQHSPNADRLLMSFNLSCEITAGNRLLKSSKNGNQIHHSSQRLALSMKMNAWRNGYFTESFRACTRLSAPIFVG